MVAEYEYSDFLSSGKVLLLTIANVLGQLSDHGLDARIRKAQMLNIWFSGGQQRLEDAEREHELTIREANVHAENGGDTLDPRLCTVSFPGRTRGVLFATFKSMGLELKPTSDLIHAMNDNSKRYPLRAVQTPIEWDEAFRGDKNWKKMNKFVTTLRNFATGEQRFAPGTLPAWFIENWGIAAWNSARKHSRTGSGVICLLAWVEYTDSVWCYMEFLFCKCLAKKYPGSVVSLVRSKSNQRPLTVRLPPGRTGLKKQSEKYLFKELLSEKSNLLVKEREYF